MIDRDSQTEGFAVSVNYDDPRWSEIKPNLYRYASSDLQICHFPIGGHGISASAVSSAETEVVMEYVAFDRAPTTREVLDEINRLGLRVPDRAEAESFMDKYPEEQMKFPIIGLCGSVMGRDDDRRVADVSASSGGRSLGFYWLGRRWGQGYRFLAVRLTFSSELGPRSSP